MNIPNALILIGTEGSDTNYEFRPTRGFLCTTEGLTEARQYVNILIEAHPYEDSPKAMVKPLGLLGDVPAELTRDKAVSIGELFPLEPVNSDEALAALRTALAGPVAMPTDLEAEPFNGADCENAGEGACIGARSASVHDGQVRCAKHESALIQHVMREPFNGGEIPGREA